jgi:hypothetical protein
MLVEKNWLVLTGNIGLTAAAPSMMAAKVGHLG